MIGNSKGEIKSKVVDIDLPDDGRNTIERASIIIIRRLTMLKVKKSEKMTVVSRRPQARKVTERSGLTVFRNDGGWIDYLVIHTIVASIEG